MLKKIGWFYVTLALVAFLIVGCKKEEATSEPESSGKAKYASTGDEGTVAGVIKFDGTAPEPKKIDMSQDPNCVSTPGDKLTDDVVVTDGKLANVFVYVKGGPVDNFTFDKTSDSAVLDQQGCRYQPRVLGIQTGQTLRVLNSDPTTHNIHPTPKNNQEWNEAQAAGAPPKEKKFNRAETLIPVKCNQHPWMQAYIGVMPHGFFAVSGKDGAYSIKGLPPGEYTLVAWHEKYGEKSQKINVAAKGSVSQDFNYGAGQAYMPTSLKIEPALMLP